MTLETLIKEYQVNWGGEIHERYRHAQLFFMGRRFAFRRTELLPVVSLHATTVTENLRSHTLSGWKRHDGIILIPH